MKRIIRTGLPNERKYGEILASVIGQMSDGIWENTNRMNGYWIYADCNSRCIDITVDKYSDYREKVRNPYSCMSDEQILNFFANKIKTIALIEMQDNYESEIKENIFGDYPTSAYRYFREDINPEDDDEYCKNSKGFWCRKDDKWKESILTREQVDILKKLYVEYERYLKEHPFVKKGKFKPDKNIKLLYLNYDEDVTLEDAYFVYKWLKNLATK